MQQAVGRETSTFVVQLAWDAHGQPTGSVQFGAEPAVVVGGWLGLMAQFVRYMPQDEPA